MKGWSYTEWKEQGDNSENFESFKLYIIKCFDEEEIFYKIGKTYTSVEKRFCDLETMPYQFEIIYIKESNPFNISKLEKKYHKELKEYKYIPLKQFVGSHECFYNIKDYGTE